MGKAAGTRAEHRVMRLLEAAGYACTRAGGSLGLFDCICVGPSDVRCIQVKYSSTGTDGYLSAAEREALTLLRVPPNVTKEFWRLRARKPPSIEVL